MSEGPGGSISDLNTTLDAGNQNLSAQFAALVAALQAIFPQATAAVTHSATAGSDTLPATPAGFITVTISGTAYKVPFYNT